MRVTPHLDFDPLRGAPNLTVKAGASESFADLMSGQVSRGADAAGLPAVPAVRRQTQGRDAAGARSEWGGDLARGPGVDSPPFMTTAQALAPALALGSVLAPPAPAVPLVSFASPVAAYGAPPEATDAAKATASKEAMPATPAPVLGAVRTVRSGRSLAPSDARLEGRPIWPDVATVGTAGALLTAPAETMLARSPLIGMPPMALSDQAPEIKTMGAPAMALPAQAPEIKTIGTPATALPAQAPEIRTIVSPKGEHIEPPQRAFGLDELGMFGLRSGMATSFEEPSAPVEAASGPSSATVAPSSSAEDTSIELPAGQPVTSAPAIVDVAASDLQPTRGDADPQALRGMAQGVAGPARAALRLAEIGSVAESPEPAVAASDPRGPNPALRSAPPLARSNVSVVVSDAADGSIQIVAGAPVLDAEAAARLRRLIDSTAAEFGERLGGVSVNGRGIESDVTRSEGDKPWR